MAFPQQHEVHFSEEDFSDPADPPQNAIAFPSLEHPQLAPTVRPSPLLGQPHDRHASLPQPGNVIFQSVNTADNRLPNEDRENIPAVEILAAHAQPQPQGLWYVDMGDMANGYPPLHGHGNPIVGDNARIAQDVPAQVQVAPPAPEMAIDIWNDQVQHAAAGAAPAFLDEDPYHGRIPNGRATEVLRQLALVYLSDPSSQLSMIRMEPTYDDGVTVVITLKLTDL